MQTNNNKTNVKAASATVLHQLRVTRHSRLCLRLASVQVHVS